MIPEDLMTALRDLSRADKLRAMQLLVIELAKDENALLLSEGDYPVWSPYDAFEAAQVLQNVLDEHKRSKHE